MSCYTPLFFVAGLLLVHVIGAPATAGSASARLTVSARVVANCAVQSEGTGCTKGIVPLRTDPVSVTVSEAVSDGVITVTVNY